MGMKPSTIGTPSDRDQEPGFRGQGSGRDLATDTTKLATKLSQWPDFRLPDLGRVSRGFPGNCLGPFSSDFLHPGRADSTPVPTRLRRVAHSNGFAVRTGIRTVVCLAAIACRQRATRRSRVGTLPQADTAGGSRSKSAISISAEVRKSEIRIWTQPSRQSITWEDSCPIAMFHRCSLRRALTGCGCC